MQGRATSIGLGVVLPLGLIVVILLADYLESPKTAYVGVLTAIPILSAVFAPPRLTAVVAVVTWLAAFGFGHLAADGNVAAQTVRLIFIALAGVVAVLASLLRERRETEFARALAQAATADELRRQAQTDALTGLLNRHGIAEALEQWDDSHVRSVALIDADDLKGINSRLGHLGGDEYLRAIAGRLSGSLSSRDLIGRWGGDEFLVIQNLPVAQATPTMQRLHDRISASPISLSGRYVDGSVSIGVAEWPPGVNLDDALAAADAALYRAKGEGGNAVAVADGD